MNPEQLAQSLKSAAHDAGFDWSGICSAVQPSGLEHFHDWLQAGYHGQMSYLPDRRDAYSHPQHVMSGAKTIVMLATRYFTQPAVQPLPGQGKIARYAWGEADYHDVIHARFKKLKLAIQELIPESTTRGVVDSAPLLEREFAQLAGLGWQGKNTLILNKQEGSWFFLSALLLDVELPSDAPVTTDHCGTCTACLDACPTDAFVQPNVLDARKCISYLTIELREPIPSELRSGIGNWLFGCDVCQDVCPWNSKAKPTAEGAFQSQSSTNPIDLLELFYIDNDAFRKRFRKSPLWRSRRRGIVRNAAIVLGNQFAAGSSGSIDAKELAITVAALARGLSDSEPLIRGASAWALGQITGDECTRLLHERWQLESDDIVKMEIGEALRIELSQ